MPESYRIAVKHRLLFQRCLESEMGQLFPRDCVAMELVSILTISDTLYYSGIRKRVLFHACDPSSVNPGR